MHKGIKIQVRHSDYDPKTGLWIPAPWKDSNTLLKQFLQCLQVQLSQVTQNVKDTGGTDRSTPAGVYVFAINAAGFATWGIQIGTSTQAVNRVDTQLITQVTTNITHGVTTFELLNPTTDDWHLLIHRTFLNGTAASINVHEVGLVGTLQAGTYYTLLDRTLYDFTLGVGIQKAVTYKFQI